MCQGPCININLFFNDGKDPQIEDIPENTKSLDDASSLYSFSVTFKDQWAAQNWLLTLWDINNHGTAETALRLLEEKEKRS